MSEESTPAPAIEPVDASWKPSEASPLPPKYFLRKIEMPLQLPCGYIDEDGTRHTEIHLAPMTGIEEDMIADAKLAKNANNINYAVANCITQLGSFASERTGLTNKRDKEDVQASRRIVPRLYLGDLTFILVALRRISFVDGNQYRFKQICPNGACEKSYAASLDLADVPVQQQTQSPEGAIHTMTAPSGLVVRYKHLHVSDTGKISQLKKQYRDEFPSAMMWLQIVDIDGEKLTNPKDLQFLSAADRDVIRVKLKDTDGGVADDDVVMSCPSCEYTWSGEMEITPSFFKPSTVS